MEEIEAKFCSQKHRYAIGRTNNTRRFRSHHSHRERTNKRRTDEQRASGRKKSKFVIYKNEWTRYGAMYCWRVLDWIFFKGNSLMCSRFSCYMSECTKLTTAMDGESKGDFVHCWLEWKNMCTWDAFGWTSNKWTKSCFTFVSRNFSIRFSW